MAISISEKQHWKERIEKKLKQRIHSLKSENPTFFSNAEVEAKALAVRELGIGDDLDHAERLKTEIRALEAQRDEKNCAVIERLSGEPMLKCHITDYGMVSKLELLLTPHVRRKFEELLEKSELAARSHDSKRRRTISWTPSGWQPHHVK